nr:hypothetical protein [uncultured Novosphingobium sp.]
MSFGDFVGLATFMGGMVAIAAILAGAYKRRLAFLERKLEIAAGQTAEKAARQAAPNAAIENRLRVLETIITDGAWDTARQIESLRAPDGEPRAN